MPQPEHRNWRKQPRLSPKEHDPVIWFLLGAILALPIGALIGGAF